MERSLSEHFAVRRQDRDLPLAEAELARALSAADALLCTVTDQVTGALIRRSSQRLRIIANYGAGYDNIDLDAARERGIVVTNTPDVLTDDTADLTIGLLLMAARRLAEGERHVRSGAWSGWRPTHMLGTRVTGKTLGIIGLGRIGRAVARRAHHGFGMRVVYVNPSPIPPAETRALGAEPRGSVEAVLGESDFVSLHVPAGPETRHLLDARRLRLMKRGAFLINTSRGGVVDESALAAALASGTIAGAGLDVYAGEPVITPELLRLENVVLLPHLGSATTEGRVAMGERAVRNLLAFFAGEHPRDRVA